MEKGVFVGFGGTVRLQKFRGISGKDTRVWVKHAAHAVAMFVLKGDDNGAPAQLQFIRGLVEEDTQGGTCHEAVVAALHKYMVEAYGGVMVSTGPDPLVVPAIEVLLGRSRSEEAASKKVAADSSHQEVAQGLQQLKLSMQLLGRRLTTNGVLVITDPVEAAAAVAAVEGSGMAAVPELTESLAGWRLVAAAAAPAAAAAAQVPEGATQLPNGKILTQDGKLLDPHARVVEKYFNTILHYLGEPTEEEVDAFRRIKLLPEEDLSGLAHRMRGQWQLLEAARGGQVLITEGEAVAQFLDLLRRDQRYGQLVQSVMPVLDQQPADSKTLMSVLAELETARTNQQRAMLERVKREALVKALDTSGESSKGDQSSGQQHVQLSSGASVKQLQNSIKQLTSRGQQNLLRAMELQGVGGGPKPGGEGWHQLPTGAAAAGWGAPQEGWGPNYDAVAAAGYGAQGGRGGGAHGAARPPPVGGGQQGQGAGWGYGRGFGGRGGGGQGARGMGLRQFQQGRGQGRGQQQPNRDILPCQGAACNHRDREEVCYVTNPHEA